MRTLIVAVTCLLFVAASAGAGQVVFQDDFENYQGWTANNGSGCSMPPTSPILGTTFPCTRSAPSVTREW